MSIRATAARGIALAAATFGPGACGRPIDRAFRMLVRVVRRPGRAVRILAIPAPGIVSPGLPPSSAEDWPS